MENFDGFLGAIAVGVMRAGLGTDTTLALVASDDIGRVAAGVLQQHEKYMHKTLAITSEAATMGDISESYRRVTGRAMPAIPTLFGAALLKLNAATREVVDEIRRLHAARKSGSPAGRTIEDEIQLARSVCTLRTYAEWKTAHDDQTGTHRGWNKVSVIRLISGRS